MDVTISARGPKNLVLVGAEEPVKSRHGRVTPRTVFVRVPPEHVLEETRPIVFRAEGRDEDGQLFVSERENVFIGPKR